MRASRGLFAAVLLALGSVLPARAQEAVVNAVLFYSPSCPHCHEVINRHLPPLRERFGDAFVVVGVDVTTRGGQELYQATVDHFAIPEGRLGVPTLVVGPHVLVGSLEIPQQLPGIVERGLAGGGLDWPPVARLREVLAAQGLLDRRPDADAEAAPGEATPPPAPSRDAATPADDTARRGARTSDAPAPGPERPQDTASAPPPATPSADDSGLSAALPDEEVFETTSATPMDRFLRDPVANGVAVAVLLLLLGVLAWSTRLVLRPGSPAPVLPRPLFPLLAAVGMGIAAYLSFVEVTGTLAVCGPVGDCNTVQQSTWAHLFGILPVGVLGLAGYVALLAAWVAARTAGEPLAGRARGALWGMAWVGTAFSAWLTFLEPFVIGATCAWCVSSALVMAVLLVGATGELHAPAAA
ncbi:MAG: hypothetical protein AMXMBFR53_24380 [Gemmatimonadota bacterium]